MDPDTDGPWDPDTEPWAQIRVHTPCIPCVKWEYVDINSTSNGCPSGWGNHRSCVTAKFLGDHLSLGLMTPDQSRMLAQGARARACGVNAPCASDHRTTRKRDAAPHASDHRPKKRARCTVAHQRRATGPPFPGIGAHPPIHYLSQSISARTVVDVCGDAVVEKWVVRKRKYPGMRKPLFPKQKRFHTGKSPEATWSRVVQYCQNEEKDAPR